MEKQLMNSIEHAKSVEQYMKAIETHLEKRKQIEIAKRGILNHSLYIKLYESILRKLRNSVLLTEQNKWNGLKTRLMLRYSQVYNSSHYKALCKEWEEQTNEIAYLTTLHNLEESLFLFISSYNEESNKRNKPND